MRSAQRRAARFSAFASAFRSRRDMFATGAPAPQLSGTISPTAIVVTNDILLPCGVDTQAWSWLAGGTGQRLFMPPNVSGWDDERWLATDIQRDDIESRGSRDLLPGYSWMPDSKALVLIEPRYRRHRVAPPAEDHDVGNDIGRKR